MIITDDLILNAILRVYKIDMVYLCVYIFLYVCVNTCFACNSGCATILFFLSSLGPLRVASLISLALGFYEMELLAISLGFIPFLLLKSLSAKSKKPTLLYYLTPNWEWSEIEWFLPKISCAKAIATASAEIRTRYTCPSFLVHLAGQEVLKYATKNILVTVNVTRFTVEIIDWTFVIEQICIQWKTLYKTLILVQLCYADCMSA